MKSVDDLREERVSRRCLWPAVRGSLETGVGLCDWPVQRVHQGTRSDRQIQDRRRKVCNLEATRSRHLRRDSVALEMEP